MTDRVERERAQALRLVRSDLEVGFINWPTYERLTATLNERFDLKAEIARQRAEGAAVIAPLSMLRCSECGVLLDSFGFCATHGEATE